MRITDYESSKNLSDVELVLTPDEAEELYLYLQKMLNKAGVSKAFLTQYAGTTIDRELTVSIEAEERELSLIA
jgi:hypothetical protein